MILKMHNMYGSTRSLKIEALSSVLDKPVSAARSAAKLCKHQTRREINTTRMMLEGQPPTARCQIPDLAVLVVRMGLVRRDGIFKETKYSAHKNAANN